MTDKAEFKLPSTIDKLKTDDGFDFVSAASFSDKKLLYSDTKSCDPILLMRLLMNHYGVDLLKLKAEIQTCQYAVADRYWVPQWSHELSKVTGTEVRGVGEVLQVILEN